LSSGIIPEGFGFNFTKIKAEHFPTLQVNFESDKDRKSKYSQEPESFRIISDNTKPGIYTIPILGDISSNLTYPSPLEDAKTTISTHGVKTVEGKLKIEIQAPLPPLDQLRNWLSEWVDPLAGTYIAISTIINGILGWRIWKGRKIKETI
jgi:hypothetical protein